MRNVLILFLFFGWFSINAQEHAWVYFKDKPNVTASLNNPLTILSQRALDRRDRQGIALDYKDVPLSNFYYNEVASKNGILIRAKSKWLNAVHIYATKEDIDALISLDFIESIVFADKNINSITQNRKQIQKRKNKFSALSDFNYGDSFNQVNQIKATFLHAQNFTGSTMVIAVLDAGFPKVNELNAFQKIRESHQILGGYNYVERSTDFYKNHRHGTSVLSTIAGFVDNELVGTAPDAKFYLFTTEDTTSETPLEESLWVEAAEKSDSLGVDIINTSLGYRDFDESRYDHVYSDMDGNTTFMAQGANIAATRGMLLVVAAGNSGNQTYFNIGTPADASNVFTVGAVDQFDNIASFSSYGPNFNNQIKPDVTAKGLQTTVINQNDAVVTGNGTSYASPVMAGAIACLWEAFPNKTNFELMQMIRMSAHLYNNPTDHEGFGIPNLEAIYQKTIASHYSFEDIITYPNPVQNKVYFRFLNNTENYLATIFDVLGNKIQTKQIHNNVLYINDMNSGVYLIHVTNNQDSLTFKIIKK